MCGLFTTTTPDPDHVMTAPTDPRHDLDARRKAARRTAIWVGLIAVGVYVAFLLSGVFGQ